ncbi:MAG: Transcriptional regulator, ArsR family / Ligand-binding SRPBCC domain protein family, partial [uncultured Nocardioidaceae bacterium]
GHLSSWCGPGVQSSRRPDPARPPRCLVHRGRSDPERPRGTGADDALRSDEAPQGPGGSRARRDAQARPGEAPLPQPRPDPAHPRPVGEQVRRTVGRRAHRSQGTAGGIM